MAYRIKFDRSKCVGCYACHMACLDAHYKAEEENAVSFRTTVKFIDREKDFEKNICPGCIHCGKCMATCPEGTIYKDKETGFILVNQELCTGCRTCESVCPIHVITFGENGTMNKCDGCIDRVREGRKPACVKVCFPGAITWEEIQ